MTILPEPVAPAGKPAGKPAGNQRDPEDNPPPPPQAGSDGALEKTLIDGEPYFCIPDVNAMPPFLMSIVSDTDLWLFAGSNAAFTAGRIDPDHAIFPYQTVDKILRQPGSVGVLSLFHVVNGEGATLWEPWHNAPAPGVQRNLYKHALGTSVVFEEIHFELGLRFRWSLELSGDYGLVRRCALTNLSPREVSVRYVDGWHHLLPAGVDEQLYSRYSYLACAYMRHERLENLGVFTLNSGVTDRAEPCESLRTTCAWSLGHADPTILLSERQLEAFRSGTPVGMENEVRGEFGACLAVDTIEIQAGAERRWIWAADTALDHSAVVALAEKLKDPASLEIALVTSLRQGQKGLRRRGAAADGIELTSDSSLDAHHFANTIFNCMRGGVPEDSYSFPSSDFTEFLSDRNRPLAVRHQSWLATLPARMELDHLQTLAETTGDRQLIRLTREYLPLLFSRRHGDPSRPWNRFSILLRDENGKPTYGYQGNWRDIFQNWEGLAQSYPKFLESMIAVFLNASTADGYNPYRITRKGIDWEVFDPEDPWSQIGYWGDHQIVYLSRLLECLERHEPGKLAAGLDEHLYSSAGVPYEIAGFEDLLRDPRHSITFDKALHQKLMSRAEKIGNDGKLLSDKEGNVALFSLAEKLLVPVLAKISNLVPGGGIWLNTQRPEWNDANNALAGWGLSVVTVFHLRRHLLVLKNIFGEADRELSLSRPTATFLRDLAEALTAFPSGAEESVDDNTRLNLIRLLGQAGERHRQAVYTREVFPGQKVSGREIVQFFNRALSLIEATLRENQRPDGLVESYNLLSIQDGKAPVSHLGLMLEGQVAALGSRFFSPSQSLRLLGALRKSELYREEQRSYMLQKDRVIPSFLSRNRLPAETAERSALLRRLLADGDHSVVVPDRNGILHFHPGFTNAADLERRLKALEDKQDLAPLVAKDRALVLGLWEEVFRHESFTGRSGSIFGFEGLGSIYWHMVAKLLLAVQECCREACAGGDPADYAQLTSAYREIREGLGFRKSPVEYGAFPTDPYSHTPRHRGAQQPGMTGQVKEEILTRLGELGVEVRAGRLRFFPRLLEPSEFLPHGGSFSYCDVNGRGQSINLPATSLGFTCCQVPVCFAVAGKEQIHVEWRDGRQETIEGSELPTGISREIFSRSDLVRGLTVNILSARLSS